MRRRIILKPTEIYKDYKKNNADILRKQHFGDAVSELKSMGFITAECLKFSEDIEKIYLCEEKMDTIYEWLEEVYGVVPQSSIVKRLKKSWRHMSVRERLRKNTVTAYLHRPRIRGKYSIRKE